MLTQRLDDAGATIERLLDGIRDLSHRYTFGPALLGALLAIGVVAGGLAAFLVIFAVLVNFFA